MTELLQQNQKKHKIQRRLRFSILYFYGSYGIFYVIAFMYHIYLPSVTIPFVIAEFDEQVKLTMDLAELFDLLYLGIIFSVNAFFTFNWLSTLLPRNKQLKKTTQIIFMISIIILNFGVVTHMVANQLNEYMHALVASGELITPGSNLEQLQLGLYFWDEIASHIFTGFGIFCLMLLFLRMEKRNNVQNLVTTKKDIWIRIMSFAVGGGIAFGLIEGQAGALFLGISCLLLIYILLMMIRTKYRDKPFITNTLFVLVGYIVFTVIYALITGLKPMYPYIKQISEVSNFF